MGQIFARSRAVEKEDPLLSTHLSLPATIPVDLNRYQGKWYDLYHYPNWFQTPGATDTTAEYILRENGTVTVINREILPGGEEHTVTGTATVVGPGKLQVEFPPSPVPGDYWVVALDAHYRIAAVSTPKCDFLWILSRDPHPSAELVEGVLAYLRHNGFATDKLVQVMHR